MLLLILIWTVLVVIPQKEGSVKHIQEICLNYDLVVIGVLAIRFSSTRFFSTLAAFNFGSSFIQWMQTFYQNISSCVLNNAFSTGPFEIQSGVCRSSSTNFTFKGPVSQSPKTLRAIFVCHNSLCILRTERT